MKKMLVLTVLVVLVVVGWKHWAGKQEALPPPAIHFSDEQLQLLITPDGRLNMAALAALLPAEQRLAALTPSDRQHVQQQFTEYLAGAQVSGEFSIHKTFSKGPHFLCAGSMRGYDRVEVQWYVPKSQAGEGLAGARSYRVSAPVDRVELLPTGPLHLRLERPAGR